MARLGQFRRDTENRWLSVNPILADGEFVLVATDTANPKNYNKWKCGDGVSRFSALPYQQDFESVGFTGEVSSNISSSLYPDNLFVSGLYIKKAASDQDQVYLLWVRNFPDKVYQMRIYVTDNTFLNVIANRSFDKTSNSWTAWNTQEIATFDRIFGFTGSQPNSVIDTITEPGTYIQTADASSPSAQAYILTVRVVNGQLQQSRERYTDGGQFVSEYRVRVDGVWDSWVQRQFAWQDEIFVFNGYINTTDPNSPNYIDDVKTPGMYRRALSDSYPIIYFVRIINSIVYQTQMYYNDGNQLVFRVRKYDNDTQTWTAWDNNVFAYNVQTFDPSTVDDLRSNGTYISSISGGGILQICPPVAPYSTGSAFTFKQIWIKPNGVNGIAWGVRYWSQEYTQWTDWCWNDLDNNRLAQNTLSKESVAFDWTGYTIYQSYVQRSTKQLVENTNYRTVVIPIVDLPKGQLFLTTACQGGGIIPISYWKSDSLSVNNYVGRDVIQTYNGANGAVYYGLPLSPIIPEGATHVAICWSYAEYQNMTISAYNPDQRRKAEQAILSTSAYMGQRTNVYDGDAVWMYKRGVSLNLVGNHSDLIIVAGQSNADGRAEKADAPQWLIDMNYKIDGYMMWNRINKRFQPWELGVNTGSYENNKNQFGFDIFFAKNYLDANPGKKLYAVKETEGSIPISPIRASGETRSACWTPKIETIPSGENSMCLQLIERLSEALAWSRDHGIVLLPQTCLWHQGEADMTNDRRSVFKENLQELLAWMRGIWGTPALPIINGGISDYYDTTYPTDSANKVFTELNAIDDYFKTVSMTGQVTIDGVHFTAAGYEYMGNGMWNYYKTFNPTYAPPALRKSKTSSTYVYDKYTD